MKVEQVSVGKIREYERNSRVHSDVQVEQIMASIREFGFANPILLGAGDVIIAGHGRFEAAKRLEMDKVPAIRLKHLTEAQQRALVIADNKIAENAGWDEELLAREIADLQQDGFDLGVLAFSDAELDKLMAEADGGLEEGLPAGVDDLPAEAAEMVSEPGDVWLLGRHRVICGDSTSGDVVAALLEGDVADLVWTDPPYNVNYEGASGSIKNDNLSGDAFSSLLEDAFRGAHEALKPGGAIYVAHADTEGRAFREAFEAVGFKLSGCLVWVKPSLVLGRSDYQWRHEPILYGWKKGAAHYWEGGRAQTTVFERFNEMMRFMPDGSVQIDVGDQTIMISGEKLSVTAEEGSVIRADRPKKNDVHPTMKPVELVARQIRNSSRKGELVYDPFGGSGSTLIACQVTDRAARLVELDPKFCDVIVRRWQQLTGEAATLKRSGRSFAELEGERCSRAA